MEQRAAGRQRSLTELLLLSLNAATAGCRQQPFAAVGSTSEFVTRGRRLDHVEPIPAHFILNPPFLAAVQGMLYNSGHRD